MDNNNCTHYWLLDSENVGHCKYCPAVKDFGKLLMKQGVFAVAGRRGAKASKEVLGKRGKEPANRVRILGTKKSAAAKKRWQDPEYRAKQSASLPSRHHKKEKLV